MLLSDGYLANGSEPWLLPDVADLPDLHVARRRPNAETTTAQPFLPPYLRDPDTLARPWAIPGTPGLEHRIGGIEKADGTGDISYDPANHDLMVRLRQAKVDGIAASIPPTRGRRPDRRRRRAGAGLGLDVRPDRRGHPPGPRRGRQGRPGPPASPQPVPGQHRRGARALSAKVLVPEMNLGQLALLLRAKYLVDAIGYNQGPRPAVQATELAEAITMQLEERLR